MTRPVVIDAHALLWFFADADKLSALANTIFSDTQSQLLLPAIALAEACWAIRKGRLSISIAQLQDALQHDARVTILPLTADVVFRASKLNADLELHDQLIVATAVSEFEKDSRTVLLTNDAEIRATTFVPVVW